MNPMKKICIYSDGGARGNPGPSAIGVLICDEDGNVLEDHAETIGETTNNVAEYRAVLAGLGLAKKYGAEEVAYFVDSELVANQLNGKYRVKTPHIRVLFQEVLTKLKSFKKVTFMQVPRTHDKITLADKLVNRALDLAGH
jgi:ribonuclease HI